MKTQNAATQNKNHNLSSVQLKTFKKFERRLNEKVPDYRIAWVRPYKKNIIEIGLESQKKSATEEAFKLSSWRLRWKTKRMSLPFCVKSAERREQSAWREATPLCAPLLYRKKARPVALQLLDGPCRFSLLI